MQWCLELLLLPYPLAAIISALMLGAPNNIKQRDAQLTVFCMLFYPAAIGLVFYLHGWHLYWFPPSVVLVLGFVVPILTGVALGHVSMTVNAIRGVQDVGYTIKPGKIYSDGSLLADADPATFEILNDGCGNLARDAHAVYHRGKIIEGAHSASFRLLGAGYARDQRQVYLEGAPLTGVDADSFENITVTSERSSFWRDRRHVYLHGEHLADADPLSFAPLPKSHYSRDRSQVFFGSRLVAGADPHTISATSDPAYARDAQRIYWQGKVILPAADAASFELVDSHLFAKDRHNVFILRALDEAALVLKNADPKTFRSLGRCYAKDAARVYYVGRAGDVRELQGAHAASFEVDLSCNLDLVYDASDAQRQYRDGKPLQVATDQSSP